MSDIFGPFCRLQGALPLNIGSGEVVKAEVEWLGTNMDTSGRIYAMQNTQIDHWGHGLPFNVHGRLCVSESPVVRWDQGVPFTGTDHVSIGAGPPAYWDQGTPFNASGQIVYSESANPLPPWIPFLWFEKDFTTDPTLWPFAQDGNHRDSWAMGADHESIQRTVTDDVPVFIGARVVRNIVADIGSWSGTGSATETPFADGYLLENLLDASGNGEVYYVALSGEDIEGRTGAGSIELKLADPADAGNKYTIAMRRNASGTSDGQSVVVTPTTAWQRYAVVWGPGLALNAGLRFGVRGHADNGGFVSVLARHPQVETEVEAPSDYIPNLTTQHHTTANGNTVNPSTGIVTEATGPSILPIEGLQLEGSRTNELANTDLMEFTANNLTAAYDTEVKAPDGSYTAVRVTDVAGGWLNRGGTIAGGDHKSIWARTVTGTATVHLLNHSNAPTLFPLTEQWKRFDAPANVGSGESTFYACDFRAAGTDEVDIITWLPQPEAATFSSSGIETPGDSATRAQTLCAAPFTDIPNLPDEGLYDEFCIHVVLDLDHASNLETGGFFFLYNKNDSSHSIDVFARTEGEVRARIRLPTEISIELPHSGGGIIDVRVKKAKDSFAFWLDGVRKGHTGANTPFAEPLNEITLNRTAAGAHSFAVYKHIKIIPAALSDEEIESWPYYIERTNEITLHPVPTTVTTSATMTAAMPNARSYKWEHAVTESAPWSEAASVMSDISGGDSATLSINSMLPPDNGFLRCRMGDRSGSSVTRPASLLRESAGATHTMTPGASGDGWYGFQKAPAYGALSPVEVLNIPGSEITSFRTNGTMVRIAISGASNAGALWVSYPEGSPEELVWNGTYYQINPSPGLDKYIQNNQGSEITLQIEYIAP